MAKPRAGGRIKKRLGPPTARKRRPQLSPEEIDWKNFPSLRRFVSERGKIRSRRITGLSRRQQTLVAKAVKRAREMGLLAYPDQDRGVRASGPSGPPPAGRPPARAAAEAAEAIEVDEDLVELPDGVDAVEDPEMAVVPMEAEPEHVEA